MKFTKRVAVLCAASATFVVSLAVAPANASTPDPYTTPGGHTTNGRLWNTSCSKYSTNVVRCRTDIWATQVTYSSGKYVPRTGWVFNNLTYLASSRSTWKGNPLGAYGTTKGTATWTSAGRQWRTECDTATTGRGGCRSFIRADVIEATKDSRGTTFYKNTNKWVFNNLVRFAEGPVKPVTSVPAHVLDRSIMTSTGFGPVQIGTKYEDLARLGYVRWDSYGECSDRWDATAALTKHGIEVENLALDRPGVVDYVQTKSARVKTAEGARVGMTVAQIRKIYGTAARLGTREGNDTLPVIAVPNGRTELLFVIETASYDSGIQNSDTVYAIIASRVNMNLAGGC